METRTAPQQRKPQPHPRPHPQSPFLDPRLRAYVTEYADRQRENDAKATEASNRWLARKAWLVAFMEQNAHLYQTETARRDKLANDYALNDAMDAWSWHMREAARCHDAVETALRMADLAERFPTTPRAPQRRP